MKQKKELSLSLSPGQKLPEEVIQALKNANAQFTRTRDFARYKRTIQNILKLPDFVPFTEQGKVFFAGFIEGEGSVSVSAKKNKTSRFGAYFDPEFSITQHVNGSIHLFKALCHFQTGSIRHKNGSNATLVYTIDARQTLKEKIIPFIKKYVSPYSCGPKEERFCRWSTFLDLLEDNAHLDLNRFLYELAPIWDQLRMQKGQSNQSFASLQEFEQYVLAFIREKPVR